MIISYPNADAFSKRVIELLNAYQDKLPSRVFLVKSMGQVRYLSAMKHASAVIGNSSSGIIEAPSFNVPTVNIGDRQKGRIAGNSVIHCGESKQAIKCAINLALSKNFRSKLETFNNPYGMGGASKKIAETLTNTRLDKLIHKRFYDTQN
jgi:UDP-hydrolysing UDP-N-acetyl-D-glucosamine 2-epimerase